ncbi:MAG TPA: transposase [Pyrinomonadaceae bacterium]|jgi:putative transposase
MIRHLVAGKEDALPSRGDLQLATKGGKYALSSQSVQALAAKLDINIRVAADLRRRELALYGSPRSMYPHRTPERQTVIWVSRSIRVGGGKIIMENGRGGTPLVLDLPVQYHDSTFRKAELVWRGGDHFDLCLCLREEIDIGFGGSESDRGRAAGVDLGEINVAAVVTEDGDGLIVNGRHLRSIKRLRNKRFAALNRCLNGCAKGSRRHRRLTRRKATVSARFSRQQRDYVHKASKSVIDFCSDAGVQRLAVGDVTSVKSGGSRGGVASQKITQWTRGKTYTYLREKGRRQGIEVERIGEEFSTRTCSACGTLRDKKLQGRTLDCGGCGASVPRDANAAANIASRHLRGRYGTVLVRKLKYLRPLK